MDRVELIVALHYVYASPLDRLVFDVGHQAYAHKLLTGRRERFHTIRTEGGLMLAEDAPGLDWLRRKSAMERRWGIESHVLGTNELRALAPALSEHIVGADFVPAEGFAPWSAETKYFQWDKKPGPYRIAVVNGYVGNTWRIQMIKTAKAYAEQPEVKAKLKEFKVVSTGEDVAAQIAAVQNFIDSGYDAIVINAQNPTAFTPVINPPNAGILGVGRLRDDPSQANTIDLWVTGDNLRKGAALNAVQMAELLIA